MLRVLRDSFEVGKLLVLKSKTGFVAVSYAILCKHHRSSDTNAISSRLQMKPDVAMQLYTSLNLLAGLQFRISNHLFVRAFSRNASKDL